MRAVQDTNADSSRVLWGRARAPWRHSTGAGTVSDQACGFGCDGSWGPSRMGHPVMQRSAGSPALARRGPHGRLAPPALAVSLPH